MSDRDGFDDGLPGRVVDFAARMAGRGGEGMHAQNPSAVYEVPFTPEWEIDLQQKRAWLVDRMLPEVGLAILAGQSGLGKSHMAMELSQAVMLGTEFAGRMVQRQGGVIYAAAEAEDDLQAQWRALRHARIGPWLERLGEDIRCPLPLCFTQGPRLTAERAFDELMSLFVRVRASMVEATRWSPVLYVTDTMSAAADFKDANDAAEVQRVMTTLQQFAVQAHLLVLLIDHVGKDQDRGVRGTSAKEAAADAVLMIKGNKLDENAVPTGLRMSQRKLRGGSGGYTVRFDLEAFDLPQQDGELLSEVKVVFDTKRAIREELKLDQRDTATPELIRAMQNALSEHGKMLAPKAGMPQVLTCTKDELRAAWLELHPNPASDAEKDVMRHQKAILNKLGRAITRGLMRRIIGVHDIDGAEQLVWLVRETSQHQMFTGA
jgi:hypothetical protein